MIIAAARMIKAVLGSPIIGRFHLNSCVRNTSIAMVPTMYPIMLNGLAGAADMNFPTLIVHSSKPIMPRMMAAGLGPCIPSQDLGRLAPTSSFMDLPARENP